MIGEILAIDTTAMSEDEKLVYCRMVIEELRALLRQREKTELCFVEGLADVAIPPETQAALADYLPQYRAKLKEIVGGL